eukprot:11191108-Lingulodinium_polyedra.AAC.1
MGHGGAASGAGGPGLSARHCANSWSQPRPAQLRRGPAPGPARCRSRWPCDVFRTTLGGAPERAP